MTENESKNQFSAETIEEAIALGLQTLGLSEEEADITAVERRPVVAQENVAVEVMLV